MAIPAWVGAVIKYGLPAVTSAISKNLPNQQNKEFPVLSYGDATLQAGDVLNPLYNEQLEKTLKQLDSANVARGFYGQLPADTMKRSTAADIERGRAGQIASLAQQMVGQSQQQAFQQQQLAAQMALNKGSQWQNMLMGLLNVYGNWMQGTERDPFDPGSAFKSPVRSQDVGASSGAISNAPFINPNTNLTPNQSVAPSTFTGTTTLPNPGTGTGFSNQLAGQSYKFAPPNQSWQRPW